MSAGASDAIKEQADEWFVRIGLGAPSAQEEAEFRAWIARDPAHEAAYRESARSLETVRQAAAQGYLPGAAVSAASTGTPRARTRVRMLVAAASLLLVAAIGVALYWPGTEERTQAGEMRMLTLADGSKVYLSGATRIRERFSDTERRVQLVEGEALFEVQKDPCRPFRVEAGSQVVQAVGTEFDVSRSDDNVEVAVSEGVVAVSPALAEAAATSSEQTSSEQGQGGVAPTQLRQGQAIAFERGIASGGVRSISVDRIGAWRKGELIFDSTPFSRLLEALGRQFGGRFVVEDPALGRKVISIAFTPQNRAEAIDLIERTLSLRAMQRSDGTTTFVTANGRK